MSSFESVVSSIRFASTFSLPPGLLVFVQSHPETERDLIVLGSDWNMHAPTDGVVETGGH